MDFETWMIGQGLDTQDAEFYEAMRDAWNAGFQAGQQACALPAPPEQPSIRMIQERP